MSRRSTSGTYLCTWCAAPLPQFLFVGVFSAESHPVQQLRAFGTAHAHDLVSSRTTSFLARVHCGRTRAQQCLWNADVDRTLVGSPATSTGDPKEIAKSVKDRRKDNSTRKGKVGGQSGMDGGAGPIFIRGSKCTKLHLSCTLQLWRDVLGERSWSRRITHSYIH